MKLKTLIAGLTVTAATVAVPSYADVSYTGSTETVAVCKAIVEDSATELRKALRHAAPRHQKLHAVRLLKGEFECNGQSLEDFAIESGSYNALSLITDKSEDQVAAR